MTVIERRALPKRHRYSVVKRWFPITPLFDLMALNAQEVEDRNTGPSAVLAYRLSAVTYSAIDTIRRNRIPDWQKRGLSEDEADAVATALGYHPSAIWAEWYEDLEVADA